MNGIEPSLRVNWELPSDKRKPLGTQIAKNLPVVQETQVQSLGQEDPLEKEMATHTPVFLPGESHGQKSLVGYSPRGSKELDTAEHTHTPPRLLTSSWQGNLQTDIGILLNKSSNT